MEFLNGLVGKAKRATGLETPAPTMGGRRHRRKGGVRRGGSTMKPTTTGTTIKTGGSHLGTSNSSRLGHSSYRGGSSLRYGPYKGGKKSKKSRKSRKSRK